MSEVVAHNRSVMRLRYNLDVDDKIALNKHYFSNSRTLLNQKIQHLIAIALFGATPFIIIYIFTSDLSYFLWGAIFVIAFTFFSSFRYNRRVISNLKRTYEEGNKTGGFDEHELQVTDSWIIEKNNTGESKTNWASIDKIVSEENHTFIFLNSLNAYIIPKDSIIEGNYGEFVQCAVDMFSKFKQ